MQDKIAQARIAATTPADAQIVEQIAAELAADDATDEQIRHQWQDQAEAELDRICRS